MYNDVGVTVSFWLAKEVRETKVLHLSEIHLGVSQAYFKCHCAAFEATDKIFYTKQGSLGW